MSAKRFSRSFHAQVRCPGCPRTYTSYEWQLLPPPPPQVTGMDARQCPCGALVEWVTAAERASSKR